MLVLSRKADESISIRCPDGTFITVRIVDIKSFGTRVRLGFDAPDNYEIHRSETWRLVALERGIEIPSEVLT